MKEVREIKGGDFFPMFNSEITSAIEDAAFNGGKYSFVLDIRNEKTPDEQCLVRVDVMPFEGGYDDDLEVPGNKTNYEEAH